jgi:hypothetical protein
MPAKAPEAALNEPANLYLLPFKTVRSLKPPDRVTLDRCGANTRSCVGVKSLMSDPRGVKLGGSIFVSQF